MYLELIFYVAKNTKTNKSGKKKTKVNILIGRN